VVLSIIELLFATTLLVAVYSWLLNIKIPNMHIRMNDLKSVALL